LAYEPVPDAMLHVIFFAWSCSFSVKVPLPSAQVKVCVVWPLFASVVLSIVPAGQSGSVATNVAVASPEDGEVRTLSMVTAVDEAGAKELLADPTARSASEAMSALVRTRFRIGPLLRLR